MRFAPRIAGALIAALAVNIAPGAAVAMAGDAAKAERQALKKLCRSRGIPWSVVHASAGTTTQRCTDGKPSKP